MKNETALSHRIKRLTNACYYMSLVSGVTIYFMFDRLDLLSILLKSGLTLATVYVIYLRSAAVKAKRSSR
ncbi:hypothetical protein [Acaryochloris marina]|nr:hypothetical protein [Acaryochloris marina]